jgi:hypothetical protein
LLKNPIPTLKNTPSEISIRNNYQTAYHLVPFKMTLSDGFFGIPCEPQLDEVNSDQCRLLLVPAHQFAVFN